MFLNDMLHPYTLVRPKYARGFSTPQYGVRSPNTLTSAAPRTYSIIRIGSELIALYASWVNSWVCPAPMFWCLTFRYIG